ncbi:MAG: xylulokinase [Pseudoflavonifractor sp.]
MRYIGIDLGTSAVKLLLTEADGTICRTVSRTYPISFPRPGWSEQRPEDWWTAVQDGMRALLAGTDGSEVAGISFGGQMHGLVILDRQDKVIRPAILWNDGRTAEQTDYLNEVVGRQVLSDCTANIAFAGFTAPKLLWLRQEEPEQFARIAKIMLPKDYLAYRLTGVHSTDYSDASGTLLLDVEHRCWSEQMLRICGIHRGQLPALYESWAITGTVLPAVAAELGLSSRCRVAAGAGDNAAAAVGTGTVGEGQCNISLGTSGTIFIPSRTFRMDPHNALHAFDHADGGYHLMGCMLSAAACNQWWMDQILGTGDYAAAQAGMERRLGENEVFFLPYLMGERSPHNDPKVRGMFLGMSMDTTRQDMTQAVLEGVTFAIRDCLEVARSLGIAPDSTKLCGGGAKSPLWRRLVANILNLRVEILAAEEGPALGAAMLAAVACGEYATVAQAADAIVRVTETVEPDPVLVARYQAQYQRFRTLYPAVRPLFS